MKTNSTFLPTRSALAGAAFLAALFFTACAPSLASAPAAMTTPTRAVESISESTQASSPTVAITPTLAPSPLAAVSVAPTITPAVVASAKFAPITVATISAGNPSGSANQVFATAIELDPTQPVSGPNPVTFYVSFNNTSGKIQPLKWIVKIWSPDNSTNSFGQTSAQINDVPPGLSEIASAANWRTNPLTCQPFYARVYSINTDLTGDPVEFKKTNGSPGPLQNFQVCPAAPK